MSPPQFSTTPNATYIPRPAAHAIIFDSDGVARGNALEALHGGV